jgi:hypothetical protein
MSASDIAFSTRSRRHAALSGHLHAPVHVVELGYGMGVRVDAHHAAEIERGLVPAPIEIKPPWVSVDLDGDLVPSGSSQ